MAGIVWISSEPFAQIFLPSVQTIAEAFVIITVVVTTIVVPAIITTVVAAIPAIITTVVSAITPVVAPIITAILSPAPTPALSLNRSLAGQTGSKYQSKRES